MIIDLKKNYIFSFIITLLLPFSVIAAPTLILPLDSKAIEMDDYLEIMEDSETTLTINNILSGNYDAKFISAKDSKLNIGFTRSAYWLRFKVTNKSQNQRPAILLLQFSNINILDFYQLSSKDKILRIVKTGNQRPLRNRDILNQKIAFTINVPTDSVNTFYLRFKNDATTNLHMSITTTDEFLHITRINNFFMGIFIGILLILIGYNFTLAYSFKDRAYFYFNFSIISILLYTITYKGYASIYFWTNHHTLDLIMLPISIGLLIIFYLLFTDIFLILKKTSPKSHNIINVIILFTLLVTIASPFFDFQNIIRLIDIIAIISFLVTIFISFNSWYRHNIIGKFFFLSTIFFFIMTLLTILVVFGYLKSHFFTDNAFILGSIQALMAMSLALAKRVKSLKHDKEKSEKELAKSIKKFELIIAYNSDIFWETDQFSTFRYISSNVKDVMGWTDKEMIGKRAFDYMTPEEVKKMGKLLNKSAVTKKSILNYKYEMKNKYDNWVILEKNAQAFYNSKGELEGFRGNDRNVTVHYQDKKILQESQEKFKAIIDNTNMGIIIIDDNYHITYANPRFEKITGYSYNKAIKMDFREFISQDMVELVSKRYKMRQQGKKVPESYEIKIINKNGTIIPVKIYIKAITKFSKGTISIVQIVDISEQKHLEEQLIMSQKMDAIGTLAGGIAHDFNNLLTVIKGYSEVLLTRFSADDKRINHIETILTASKKAEALTKQILAFSRKQIYQTQRIDVNQQLDDFINMTRRIIGEDIFIETTFDKESLSIKADPGQIEQVVINLLVNARDAIIQNKQTNEKKISIKTRLVDSENIVNFDTISNKEDKYVEISVRDSGVGMTDKVKMKIFEPFFTTKDKNKSTGLGLATVYGIVAQNKGYIDVESELHNGTCFKIYWPAIKHKND
jgi:PAS domain S-box-containing protein